MIGASKKGTMATGRTADRLATHILTPNVRACCAAESAFSGLFTLQTRAPTERSALICTCQLAINWELPTVQFGRVLRLGPGRGN